jgi:exopolysaccharide biosynthesis polyprenyl glycosylphosphotransferase
VALPLADLLGLAAAVIVTGRIGLPEAVYAGIALAVLALGGQHRLRICLRVSDQVGRILTAAALPLPLLLPWLSAGLAWRLALSSAISVMVARSLACCALRAAHRRGLLIEPALVVGAGEMGVLVAGLLAQHPELGLRPVGFLDACPAPNDLPLPVLGAAADLPAVIRRFRVRRVIVCFPADRDRDLVPVLRACQPLHVDICLLPRLQELGAAVPRACLDEVWGIPLIPLRRGIQVPAGMLAKRAFDVLVAAILLCAASPVLLVLVAVIRLSSGRPAIFRQVRITGEDRIAPIMKLRTLDEHSDSDTRWSVPARQCGPLSQWLRAAHLDELPQLVNVLRGEMSLVGPRPERPYFAERFSHEIPRYDDRHRMPAGITGWAQVHGLHGDTSIDERARFDNQYIEYWSPWLDLVILARTFAASIAPGRGSRR